MCGLYRARGIIEAGAKTRAAYIDTTVQHYAIALLPAPSALKRETVRFRRAVHVTHSWTRFGRFTSSLSLSQGRSTRFTGPIHHYTFVLGRAASDSSKSYKHHDVVDCSSRPLGGRFVGDWSADGRVVAKAPSMVLDLTNGFVVEQSPPWWRLDGDVTADTPRESCRPSLEPPAGSCHVGWNAPGPWTAKMTASDGEPAPWPLLASSGSSSLPQRQQRAHQHAQKQKRSRRPRKSKSISSVTSSSAIVKRAVDLTARSGSTGGSGTGGGDKGAGCVGGDGSAGGLGGEGGKGGGDGGVRGW